MCCALCQNRSIIFTAGIGKKEVRRERIEKKNCVLAFPITYLAMALKTVL